MGKKEEITDLISDEAYLDPQFKKGLALKFRDATIKITKIDRKNKRVWGEHIVLVDQKLAGSHDGHYVLHDKATYDEYDIPFCKDCKVPVDQPSTEDGEKKALDRKDRLENESAKGKTSEK